MEAKRNYQKELERLIATLNGRRPTLLLHSCCAPCSSCVLEYLAQYFKITLFYYNPNISPESEYRTRIGELHRLVAEMLPGSDVEILEGAYEPERFHQAVKGLEEAPEGGTRCEICYRIRLEEAAKMAQQLGSDYFTTTLTTGPMKNARKLNEIGEELAPIYSTAYLNSDFKKKDGYKRSIQLSAEYGLYRQDYCGCVYSRRAREKQKAK